jgi:anti-sigma regulatory factor (Ser/Thr protein kinase)
VATNDELVADLRVPATSEGMDQIHAALEFCRRRLRETRTLEQEWCDAFVLAVAEVAANIIQHAYPPGATDPRFSLSVTQTGDHLTARLVDWGVATTSPEVAAETSPVPLSVDQLRDRGRGLAIIRMTTDYFAYDRTPHGENVWVIEKRFV